MDTNLKGPWTSSQVGHFLQQTTVPLRLSCVAPDGFPRVVSLWYAYRDDALLCVTHQSSKLVSLLSQNPRVGFEVAPDSPPYRGVRGQGLAAMAPLGDDQTLHDLLENYIGNVESDFSRWLLSRAADEIVISVTPTRLYSWDYTERMTAVASGQE